MKFFITNMSSIPSECEYIKKIPELDKANVHIRDAAKVDSILKDLIAGGRRKLQIVADFDSTLTKPEVGLKFFSLGSISHLHNSDLMPKEFREECSAPISSKEDLQEIARLALKADPEMFHSRGRQIFATWASIYKKYKLTKSDISRVMQQSSVYMRDGIKIFLHLLDERNVPLVVVSAGIGDIISSLFRSRAVLLSNMHLLANFLKFNEQEEVVGLARQNEVIHFTNKNEFVGEHAEKCPELLMRNNIILLGDRPSDANAAHNLTISTSLKIALLKPDDDLETFLKCYDIVIADFDSIDIVTRIIEKVTNH